MRLYHGTDVESALGLLNGDELDGTIAADRHINGAPGFYLATEEGDAEFFAIRRDLGRGAIVAFDIDDDVVDELRECGGVTGPIPRSPASPFFAGDEFYLPMTCFDVFNQACAEGRIHAVQP
jgi:hypothetical protein